MDWEDIEQKHMAQIGEFEKLRDKAWQGIKADHDAMREAFGNREEDMPASVHEKIEKDRITWQEEWGNEGTKMKELKATQQKDRERHVEREKFKQQIKEVPNRNRSHDKGRS